MAVEKQQHNRFDCEDKQTDKQTDYQTDREKNRQTY